MFVHKARFAFVLQLQLDPGNSNCYGRLKLLRVTGILNNKTRKTCFKRFNSYTRFIVTLNFEGKKKHVIIALKNELGKTDK